MNSGDFIFAIGIFLIIVAAILFWISISPVDFIHLICAAFILGMSCPFTMIGIRLQQIEYWEQHNKVVGIS